MRVVASGICGSDVMEWYRRDKVPLVLGHEVAGEVDKVGNGVDKFKTGDRIAATHHVPCNTCRYCLSGHHTMCETLLKGTSFIRAVLQNTSGSLPYMWTEGSFTSRMVSPMNMHRSWSLSPVSCEVKKMRT